MKIIILEQAFVLYVKALYDDLNQSFFYFLRVRKDVEAQIHFSLQ